MLYLSWNLNDNSRQGRPTRGTNGDQTVVGQLVAAPSSSQTWWLDSEPELMVLWDQQQGVHQPELNNVPAGAILSTIVALWTEVPGPLRADLRTLRCDRAGQQCYFCPLRYSSIRNQTTTSSRPLTELPPSPA